MAAPQPRSGRSRPGARRRWSSIERDLRRRGIELIAGVDEVGRGSLAGPVVACAIVMPPGASTIRGVDDSKLLTPVERRRLCTRILDRALAVGIGAASVREIDRLNIYYASALAMRRALEQLAVIPQHTLIDGRPIRALAWPHTAVVDGDDRCYHIACASIVAKVTRDRLMARLAERYPGFSWERNCGYATPDHIASLAADGATLHHRRSFVVKALSAPRESPAPDDAARTDAAPTGTPRAAGDRAERQAPADSAPPQSIP
ncbi:MAG TPA: ribonuclease HII [Gemmatimonadaceae bacterium]|nr:ribonuclease HII [Gemmatimonadaceae bacterium]